MIRYSCACGRQLQGRDEDAGKQAKCPECGAVGVIPRAEGVTAADDLPPRRAERARPDAVQEDRPRRRAGGDDYDEDRPRRRRPPDAPEATSGKATAAMVLGIISFPCIVGNALTGLPAVILGALALKDIGQSEGRLGGKGMALTGVITGCLGMFLAVPAVLIGLLLPAVQKVREVAARTQDANNLKQMALAMHNFNSNYGAFPQATAFRSPEGKPLLSWRVALLPYVEQDNLYKQFKLDEPWDSPHNKQFLAMIPKVYLQPEQIPDGSGMTHYQVFVGPKTMFEEQPSKEQRGGFPGLNAPRLGIPITEITDGLSNTIMIATAATPVPWTKPVDLPFDPLAPLPALGGQNPRGFNIALGDGAVRFLPKNVPESVLKAAITRNGGEVVQLP
jgi:hypothetical protein